MDTPFRRTVARVALAALAGLASTVGAADRRHRANVDSAPLGTSVAALEVTSFEIGAAQSGAYYPKVILRETSGLSDARLTSLDFQAPGGEVNRISRHAEQAAQSPIRGCTAGRSRDLAQVSVDPAGKSTAPAPSSSCS